MTAGAPHKSSPKVAGALLALLTVALVASLGCGVTYFEIPIETPIQPKLDVSAFQRVLIAGFVTGGSDDVDANQETVRLLRSQLRTKSSLRVIDADIMPLVEIAQGQNKSVGDAGQGTTAESPEPGAAPEPSDLQPLPLPDEIRNERDLEQYERLFANTAYWRQIGEEYQSPLIVTGTVLFMPHSRAGFVSRDVEQYDSFGRRRVVPTRTYMERKGFILRPKFVFIDGRTGSTIHQETYREEILYNAQQNTPALSSYFELMDRLVPSFLSALSSQKIRGTRILLL
jgi:hypothetical protein